MTIRSCFENGYLNSLRSYRLFYDDVHEYGNPDQASHVFYFIPGLNGVPGQIRFTLPAFHQVLGHRFYIRGLHMPEFAAMQPVWEKYTEQNVLRRRQVICEDLEGLIERFGRLYVLTSSTGFYEFAAALVDCPAHLRQSMTVLWAAAAPDSFMPSRWESVFRPLSGIIRNGCSWTALPNHDAFGILNPEARATHRWRGETGAQTLYKTNLESRFRAFGLSWAYFSIERINWFMRICTDCVKEPIEMDAYVLAGSRDGYWQGKSPDEMMQVIGRYLAQPRYVWKKASHLWVTIPPNISELISLATGVPVKKPSGVSSLAVEDGIASAAGRQALQDTAGFQVPQIER